MGAERAPANVDMRNRLLIVLAFPILAQLCFSTYGALEKSRVVAHMSELEALTSLAVAASELATELQRERGLSAGFLSSKGTKFGAALVAKRGQTDVRRRTLEDRLATTDGQYIDGALRSRSDKGKALLARLADMRLAVSEQRISAAEEIQYYTSCVSALLDMVGRLPGRAREPSLSRDLLAYLSLLQMKENAGVERATLNAAFSADALAPQLLEQLHRAVAAQDLHEATFLSLATPAQVELLRKVHSGKPIDEARRLRSIAIAKGNEGHFGVDPALWFDVQSARIDLLTRVEQELSSELIKSAGSLKSGARTAFLWYVSSAVGVLLLGAAFVVLVIRSVAALEARARMLALSEQGMQFVLDGMGDGLLVADLGGVLARERSRIVSDWFGPQPPEPCKIWDYLFEDPTTREMAELGFAEIAANIMPFELLAHQMPRRVRRNDVDLELSYKQAFEAGELSRVIVIIRDVTDEVARAKADKQNRELQAVIFNLLRDKTAFKSFMTECTHLIEGLAKHASNVSRVKRDIHTIKGITATFGFQRVSEFCHALEDRMAIGEEPSEGDTETLLALWRESLEMIEGFVGVDDTSNVQILSVEHEKLLEYLRERRDYEDLIRLVQSWRDEPTRSRLTQLARQAQELAQRLGKEVVVSIADNGLRVPESLLGEFWSAAVHVVRNAIDHGLELPAARASLGKRPAGRLNLATSAEEDFLSFSVEDDGRGIDWENIRTRAKELGLPAESEEDLKEALFSDGVSTKGQATEYSGRGLGLSALREACRRKGGSIDVVSSPGTGTRFSFRFPIADNPDLRFVGPSLPPLSSSS